MPNWWSRLSVPVAADDRVIEGCEGSSEKTKKQNQNAWWKKEKWAKRKKVMS